jgi:hypothetical protein
LILCGFDVKSLKKMEFRLRERKNREREGEVGSCGGESKREWKK